MMKKMNKNQFEHTGGDMGTKEAEETLKRTPAGKKPSMKDAFGSYVPHMGKAIDYLEKRKGKKPKGRCYMPMVADED